jgi:hypothetical protein
MGILRNALVHLAWGGLFASSVVGQVLPVAAQQASIENRQSSAAPTVPGERDQDLPDSPGATLARAQAPALRQNTSGQSSPPQNASAQSTASPSEQSQAAPQRPVGTAVAETPISSGVAASEPAGVAIAPAKQRRARTIIIKTGAIIGAAVALGVVIGLTEATPSKPPGAH